MLRRRRRFRRDEATRWVWIIYGLTQAVLTMLLAFNAITSTMPSEITTGVALIVYVAVSELYVRPSFRRDDPDGGAARPPTPTTGRRTAPLVPPPPPSRSPLQPEH